MRYISSASLGIILVFFSGVAFANPYIIVGLETSNSPHRGTELQSRFELGYEFNDRWQFYTYHESDPRNGTEGTGYVGETENGVGLRYRYEWD